MFILLSRIAQKRFMPVVVVRGYHKYENVWNAPIDETEPPVERKCNPMDV